jgi:DNA-binding MarR family transcriptional regulator
MSDSKSPESIRELLAAIETSFREDDESCFRLNVIEADRQLAEHHINPEGALKQLTEILESAKAQARLDKAQAQRLYLIDLLPKCREKLRSVAVPLKEEVLAILQGLSPSKTDAIEAYFRKFEQSSEKDVQTLLEDLELLRAMKERCGDNNDGKSD